MISVGKIQAVGVFYFALVMWPESGFWEVGFGVGSCMLYVCPAVSHVIWELCFRI